MISHLSTRHQTLLGVLTGLACVGACAVAMRADHDQLRWMMKVALVGETVLMLVFAWFTSRRLIRR
jgi:uncharacterized membrane protein